MLSSPERLEIHRLWTRKLEQDASGLPQSQRHRNLEPPGAEFLHALAAGITARRLVEIGGSSGISTIARAAAAREAGGRLLSLEIEPARQAEARETLSRLGLAAFVDFVLADAAQILPQQAPFDLALIDWPMRDGGIVVADNIFRTRSPLVAHGGNRPGVESITLPIGKGLEVTRLA